MFGNFHSYHTVSHNRSQHPSPTCVSVLKVLERHNYLLRIEKSTVSTFETLVERM